jgi:putative endonuclease
MSYEAGKSAEDRVSSDYERRGFTVAHARWRGKSGEIDLILRNGDGFVFVEVKQSRSFGHAASHVTERQVARLYQAVDEYLADQPDGLLTDVRFDVALVDGHGALNIIENAFA